MAEVVEQPEFEASCLQVIVNLTPMSVAQVRNGFEFNDNTIIANEISTIRLFQFLSIIIYLQFFLSDKRYATLCEFNGQSFLIDRFEKANT